MPTISPPTTRKIRRCFFFSLAFVIIIPMTCIVLGVTLHPKEFQYIPTDPSANRTVSSSLILTHCWTHSERFPFMLIWYQQTWSKGRWSSNGALRTIAVLQDVQMITVLWKDAQISIFILTRKYYPWTWICNQTCWSSIVEISFTLMQETAGPSTTTDPWIPHSSGMPQQAIKMTLLGSRRFRLNLLLFHHLATILRSIWSDIHVQVRCIIPLIGNVLLFVEWVWLILPNSYLAVIFGFAEDASTNATVSLYLESTSGLAV